MKPTPPALLIEVEVCSNCATHTWCSRHDESKYNQFYEHLKARVEKLGRDVRVVRKPVPASYRKIQDKFHGGDNRYFDLSNNQTVFFPRFGAFQIFANGILIFSKLKSSLWPNSDRIVHLIEAMVIAQAQGQDLNTFSLDYRLANDQNQHFVDTYKAEIVKQLSSSRKRVFSQEKYPSPGKINFKSRKIMTRSKNKQPILQNSSQGSPIINRQKFKIRDEGRPQSRDKHVHTLEDDSQKQQEISSDRKQGVEIHKWNIVNQKTPPERKKVLQPVQDLKKSKLHSLIDKKSKLGEEGSPKIIKVNKNRLKNEPSREINQSNGSDIQQSNNQKQKLKKQQEINGWTQKQAPSEFVISQKQKTKEQQKIGPLLSTKMEKKPSITQKLQKFQSSSSQFIIQDSQKQVKKPEQKEQNKKESARQSVYSNDVLQNLESSNNFEQAKSEISWQGQEMHRKYTETVHWQASTQRQGTKISWVLCSELEKQQNEPLQRSQIIKHHSKSQKTSQNQPEQIIEPGIQAETIMWVAQYNKKGYTLNRQEQTGDEVYSVVDAVDEEEQEVNYDDFVKELEEHQGSVHGQEVIVIHDKADQHKNSVKQPKQMHIHAHHIEFPSIEWDACYTSGLFVLQSAEGQQKRNQAQQQKQRQALPNEKQKPKQQSVMDWMGRYSKGVFSLQQDPS